MRGRGASAVLVACTLCSGAASAQDAPEEGLELPALIEKALETSPDLEEIRADVDQEIINLNRARYGRFPRANYNQVFGVVPEARGNAVFSPDEDIEFFDGLGPFTRIELNVVQPLYTFGAISKGIEAAEHGLASMTAVERQEEAEVVQAVAELYYNLLLSRELEGAFDDLVSALEEALEAAEERLAEGEAGVTQEDVLKLRFALASFQERFAEVKMGRGLAQSALRRAAGVPPEEQFRVSGKKLRPLELELEPLEYYVDVAMEERPEVKSLTEAVQARRADAARLKAELYPAFFATGVFRYAVAPNRTDQRNPFVRDDFNYIYGGVVLGLNWEFDFGKLAEIDEVETEERKLLAQRRKLVTGLRLEVEQALRTLENAQRRVELGRSRRKASRSLLVVAAANYELGIGAADLILEALGMHAEGVGKYYEAVRDLNLAVARLYRTIGLLQTEAYQKLLRPEKAAP